VAYSAAVRWSSVRGRTHYRDKEDNKLSIEILETTWPEVVA